MFDLILENISKHIQPTTSETDVFTSVLQQRKLRKRQYLLQAGDVARFKNFVTKGLLRAYNVDKTGTLPRFQWSTFHFQTIA